MQNPDLLPQRFVHRGHGLKLLAQVQVLGAQITGSLLFAFERRLEAVLACAGLSAAQAAIPPAGLRVLLQREADGGNRLAGLRDGDDGFGTCGNLEAARRFQLAVAGLELNFLLLAAS